MPISCQQRGNKNLRVLKMVRYVKVLKPIDPQAYKYPSNVIIPIYGIALIKSRYETIMTEHIKRPAEISSYSPVVR